MAQKYLNLEQAAERLGMSVGDVNAMRERGELRAYRDGANWKFPAEAIEQKAEELGPQATASDGIEIAGDVSEEDSDVLLSETELGESGIGASGTIIGDVELGDDEPIRIDSPATSDIDLGGKESVEDGDGLVLSDSQLGPSEVGSAAQSGSTLNLDSLDDDDLVLGDSGSNISIGGDSGIALVDPADSGLALDEPLQLTGGSGELELGEDDAVDLGQGSGTGSAADLRAAESDFTLSTLEEEDDDSDSGSQVIAIEDEETGSGFGGSGSMPPMLDGEDFGGEAVGATAGLGDFDAGGLDAGGLEAATPAQQPQAAGVDYSLPEAPYTIWNVLSLSFCVLFMSFAGMMSYDLLRNMWSWDKPYALNSSLMDMICGMLGL